MTSIDWKNESVVRAYVQGAKSKAEILRRIGACPTGAGMRTLEKYAALYNLELPVYDRKLHGTKQIPLAEILVLGSTYQSVKLKARLLSEDLIVNRCLLCRQWPVWNGEPLVLQLDHINGDTTDNRIENLRLLCPNCHTQTKTWGRKGR